MQYYHWRPLKYAPIFGSRNPIKIDSATCCRAYNFLFLNSKFKSLRLYCCFMLPRILCPKYQLGKTVTTLLPSVWVCSSTDTLPSCIFYRLFSETKKKTRVKKFSILPRSPNKCFALNTVNINFNKKQMAASLLECQFLIAVAKWALRIKGGVSVIYLRIKGGVSVTYFSMERNSSSK